MRLHTEETLKLLDDVTTSLGDALRIFKADTCSQFNTRELPREVTSRTKRGAKKPRKQGPTSAMAAKGPTSKTYKGKDVGTQRSEGSGRGHGSPQDSTQQVPLQGKVTSCGYSESVLTLSLAVPLRSHLLCIAGAC